MRQAGGLALGWAIVLVLVLAACDGKASPTVAPTPTSTPVPGDVPTPTTAPTPTSTQVAGDLPVYERADCRFEPPPGETVECGYLTVPEDRSVANGPTIRLHVALFRSQSDELAPDPVVYLEGGPGGNSLEVAPLIFNRFFAPFLRNRDFIMFDQRGTGFSEPPLDCPEFSRLVYDTLDQDLSAEDEVALSSEAVLECRDRLERAGVNLSAYTSAENAADLEDLRQALGYDEWNLYGISYGTKLALTTLRDYPEGIRSVILDSSYPLQVDGYASFLPNADRAFDLFFDDCAADARCNAAYPDLEKTFFQLAEDLNGIPVTLSITHPLTGQGFKELLKGDGLKGFLFKSLHSGGIIPLLPEIIFDARDGRFRSLALIEGSFLLDVDTLSVGMHLSVQCGEELRFASLEEIAAASAAHPRLRDLVDSDPTYSICQDWGARRAGPVENEPVISSVPALVLAGEYDPITPPAWGELVAGNLSNSFYFEFPSVGHGVSISGPCPLIITLEFLDNPTSDPDASCIAGMGGPAFAVPKERLP